MISWQKLSKPEQIAEILHKSHEAPQVVFKHSTRCSISHMAKGRLERVEAPEGIDFHYLDLIQYRDISNRIADEWQVWHESPQVIVLRKGEVVFDESHNAIHMDEIVAECTKSLS